MELFDQDVALLDFSAPVEIGQSVLMATEDITIKINALIDILDVFCHFRSISFEKSAYSSNKESISSKSAGMRVEGLYFFTFNRS
jgi:hypothetical protein